VHARTAGLGVDEVARIEVKGFEWEAFEKKRLRYPEPVARHTESVADRVSRRLNNTILRPRPVIDRSRCTECAACISRCPVGAIGQRAGGLSIDRSACADCGCCVKVCDAGAVHKEFVGTARAVRWLAGRLRDQRFVQNA
jgi:Fe-S-cluster-containing hydrogenase component 2